MRPSNGTENIEIRPRKSSFADSSNPTDRYHHSPTTFFLSRDVDSTKPSTSSQAGISTLQETIDEAAALYPAVGSRGPTGEGRGETRRRSTIRAVNSSKRLRRSSSTSDGAFQADRLAISPPALSAEPSTPSSPKSFSSRSALKSDDGIITDDGSSQAIASSEDDETNSPPVGQDSQPELIMPSIKMPSRRPFTTRGKQLGRYKVLVAGTKGVGKTSLIKSIVQVCEDIVHVDPLHSTPPLHDNSPCEIYASTRPYPKWWTDLDESRILRRRKSIGDSVLERNICFVDTADCTKMDQVVHYIEQQLVRAIASTNGVGQELSSLLSGRGGSQVDVVLYILSQETLREDCEYIRRLSEIANVVPLLAKADLLSDEEKRLTKQNFDIPSITLPRIAREQSATAPYTVTSVNGPDSDNMDASLLMSSEYIQPLLPSELNLLVDHLFSVDTIAYLRHTAARKLCSWHATHPTLIQTPSPSVKSHNNSTLGSPIGTSLSHSGIILPPGSELSLTTSNSLAVTRLADHSQREERLAQVRLSKWASDLQISLQREREKFERLARGERASWLMERMGEEIRDGQILALEKCSSYQQPTHQMGNDLLEHPIYQVHDPLGLLHWQETVRTRGWIALQIVGSFGVVGGLAVWFAKTWGLTSTWNEWTRGWYSSE